MNQQLYKISFYSLKTDETYEHYIVTNDLLNVLLNEEKNNILTFDSFSVKKVSSEIIVKNVN